MTTQLKIPLGAVNIQIKDRISSTGTVTGSWATGLRYIWSLRLLYLTFFVCVAFCMPLLVVLVLINEVPVKAVSSRKKTKKHRWNYMGNMSRTFSFWWCFIVLWLSLHQIVTGFCTGEWWEERLGGGDKDWKAGQKSEAKLVWCSVVVVGEIELVV